MFAVAITVMMMAVIMDRDLISALSAESDFPSGPLEKVIRLGEVAASVARHPLLSRVLALKGGTALNLFSGLPIRLSVDLDFNYIGALDRVKTGQRTSVLTGASGPAVPAASGRFRCGRRWSAF